MPHSYNLRKRPAASEETQQVTQTKKTKVSAKNVVEKKTKEPELIQPEVTKPEANETKLKESKVKELKVKEPRVKETRVKNLKVVESKEKELKVEHSETKTQLETKELKVKESKVKNLKVKESKVKEIKVKEPKVKETKDRGLIDKKAVIEEDVVIEPAVEEPVIKEPVIEKLVHKEAKKSVVKKFIATLGTDSCGELGLGSIGIQRLNPSLLTLEEDVLNVACGAMHTVCLLRSGKIITFGCNDELALGRLTDGDEELEATPKLVELDEIFIKVTAGDSHSAALSKDNKVYIWGNFRDEHGSVGLTPECDGKASVKPIQVLRDVKIKDIASGSNHMLLASVDGEVYSFGVGEQGQLGRIESDKLIKDGKSAPIDKSNSELFLTPKLVDMSKVDPQRKFVCDSVFAGNYSSFANTIDKKKNRLAGWGLNNYNQLGFKGQKEQNVQHSPKRSTFTCSTSMTNVACGQHHTLFLTKTGRVYSAGRHDYGMLGLGKVEDSVCPAKQVDNFDGKKVIAISAGINTSFALTEEGEFYSWGMNGKNLGIKTDEDLKVPTKVNSKNLDGRKVFAISSGSSHTALIIE